MYICMQIVCKFMKPHVVLYHDTRRKKADGSYPVKVRVTFNRRQKYYPTNVDLTSEQFLNIHSDKVARKHQKIRDVVFGALAKAKQVCDELKVFNFTLFEKQYYTIRTNDSNLKSLYDEYELSLRSEGRIGTATSYHCSYKSLAEFRPKIRIEDVTVEFLKQYEKWMLNEGKSLTSVGIYLRPLRALLNTAISNGLLVREQYPFGRGRYEIPAGQNIKKALTIADVGKIYKYITIEGTTKDKAKDFWMLTYFCNGINMKDIALLKYKNISGEFIQFIRAKTEHTTRKNFKPISIFINDQTRTIIRKWGNEDTTPDTYIFPILNKDMTDEQKYAAIQQFTKTVNKYMKLIATDLNLEKHVTTYTARHTYSTVLKRSGASIEFISEALGHSNKKTTENYLDSFEQDAQREFAKKLLAF